MKLLVRRVGDDLKFLHLNGQVSQDRGRQREHRLPPSRGELRAGMPKVVVRLGCQPVMLVLDRVFVGHECDYDTFRGPRLSPVRFERSALCYPCSMARQPPKPLAARVSGWGATGILNGSRPLLTSAQYAEMRRKRADVDAKLKQLTRPSANGGAKSITSSVIEV